MPTLNETVSRFLQQPEQYILCRKELLSELLQRDPLAIDCPYGESIHADVLDHQVCTIEKACVQGGALKIKHFGVSTIDFFDDIKNVDLRRRGIGRSMMIGLARVLNSTCNINFIDFDLSLVRGQGGAEAYAKFTDGLGALPHGNLRRLPIATLLA